MIAVDVSPPMLERARAALFTDRRVEVGRWDLSEDLSPMGQFDLIVSGFAIHHLEDGRKRSLFDEVARQLLPSGLFANLEIVASPTPALHAEFLSAIGRSADDPEDRLVDVETQLAWMKDAGLSHVACVWRWRGMALLVGRSSVT